jgi:hypothetical protein
LIQESRESGRQSHGAEHALTPSRSRRLTGGAIGLALVMVMALILSALSGSSNATTKISAIRPGSTTTEAQRSPAPNVIRAGNESVKRFNTYISIAYLHQVQVQNYWRAEYLLAKAKEIEAARANASTNHGYAHAPVYSGSNMGGFLNCVRQRESTGDYGVVNSTGHAGAYQFAQSTWDATARHIGRFDLVGVAPNLAPPAVQDMMAQALYAWQGRGPWANPGGKQC